jgi:hypothetical protein
MINKYLVMSWGFCNFVMLLVQGYTWVHLAYVFRGGASVLQPAHILKINNGEIVSPLFGCEVRTGFEPVWDLLFWIPYH